MDAWTSPNHCAFVAWTVHLEFEGEMLAFLLDIIEVPKVCLPTLLMMFFFSNWTILASLTQALHWHQHSKICSSALGLKTRYFFSPLIVFDSQCSVDTFLQCR